MRFSDHVIHLSVLPVQFFLIASSVLPRIFPNNKLSTITRIWAKVLLNMASAAPHFSPACPIPPDLDAQTRVKQLKDALKEDCWQFQKANILKLIELYESGELKPPSFRDTIWLCDGKVLDKEPGLGDTPKNAILWAEVSY